MSELKRKLKSTWTDVKSFALTVFGPIETNRSNTAILCSAVEIQPNGDITYNRELYYAMLGEFNSRGWNRFETATFFDWHQKHYSYEQNKLGTMSKYIAKIRFEQYDIHKSFNG